MNAAIAPEEKQYLRTRELARRLSLSDRTITNWSRKGLPCVRVGKVILYDWAAVESWLRQR